MGSFAEMTGDTRLSERSASIALSADPESVPSPRYTFICIRRLYSTGALSSVPTGAPRILRVRQICERVTLMRLSQSGDIWS